MYRKILLIFILFSFTINAQDTIRGKMSPKKEFKQIALYSLNSVNKVYLAHSVIVDGKFKIAVPKGTKTGMLRLEYSIKNNLYIDLIYTNENIDFEFHPDYPSNLVKFHISNENKLFQKFIDESSVIQNKLDSVQVVYFQTKNANTEKILATIYSKELIKLNSVQNLYSKKSKGKTVGHFINANKRHYNSKLIKDTDAYLNNLKAHYFNNINFNNETLARSSIFIDRIMDYVLYLTNAKEHNKQIELRKQAVTNSLNKISNDKLKKEVMHSLLYMFAQQENKEITDYIFDAIFTKLPIALQDYEFKDMINDMFKTTIGQLAPNIEWDVYGKPYSLAALEKSEYYVVVFWGSTCPHCMIEIPKFNEYLVDYKNIKSIAIGIENDDSKASWKEETFNLENITHVLALGKDGNKWNNKIVKDYGVTGTPSYYVLDSNKVIIAKPYDFKELKVFFKSLEKK